MDTRGRLTLASVGAAGLFLLVELGALALAEPFVSAGYQAVKDPGNPANSLLYLVAILVMTGILLVIIRFGATWLLRAVIILLSAMLTWYVFSVVVPVLGGPSGVVAPTVLAGVVALALYVHPEWYVIDVAGVLIGAGGAGLFGISFGPLPAVLLLLALAVYDAVAVYGTRHMLTLAESVTTLKLPLLLVVPLSSAYSFLDEGPLDTDAETAPEEREAFFIGVGDAVMPTILVASAAVFVGAPSLGVPGLALNLPALGALLGTQLGLLALLWLVARGRPQAGLPLLNGGAILGFLVGALLAGVPLVQALGLAPYL